MYVRVYSPEGELFEVPRDRADRLILQDGWTQSPVTKSPTSADADEPEPVSESKRRQPRKVAAAKASKEA